MTAPSPNPSPLVSVIMATYSGDDLAFLSLAIGSILSQDYPNIEFLITADGPLRPEQDACLDQIARANKRVRLLRLEKNVGRSHARNHAIRAATGEFLAITDSDDLSVPNRISRQVEFLQNSGADFAGSFMHYIDESGMIYSGKEAPLTHRAILRYMFVFNPMNSATVMGRTELFQRFGYDEALDYGEDWSLWINAARAGHTFANQPEYLYQARAERDFLGRRSGWKYFRIELGLRLRALALYPLVLRPFLAPVALGISALRLLPPPILRLIYDVRSAIRFVAKSPAPPS